MKLLMLDVERSPNIAYVWGLFKENVPLARLIDTSQLMCYAAKWNQEDEVFFDSIHHNSPKGMLKGLHKLIDTADAVCHYNGNAFDMPVINTEFVKMRMKPPAPYKNIDLLKTVRQQFKFTSNKMDHVSEQIGCGRKHEVDFQLWVDCMAGDDEAWDTMRAYNIEDVMILERMYEKLKPWIKGHPNQGLYGDSGLVCPTCQSGTVQRRGFSFTAAGRYQRYQCSDCGSWFRDRKSDETGRNTYRHC